ncbi:hypothetical protein EXS56_02355 [Candidatus Kaiserbacteria bacterium]|nr:hypothetical protein [Candidatus Kaiserbacteria bacterium]
MLGPWRAIVALIAVGIVAGIGSAVYRAHHFPTLVPLSYFHDERVDFREALAYWRRLIDEVGPDAAHNEFVKEGNTMKISEAHTLAHTFGEALFDEEGITGFSTCDDSFLYGCYHNFIGSAISKIGLIALDEVVVECDKKSPRDILSCRHGIGHALVGYLGYSLENLKKALSMCSSLDYASNWDGCFDGAFMEYNTNEMNASSKGDFTPRPLSSANVYTPCDSVSEELRAACVYQLPFWYARVSDPTPRDVNHRLEQIGVRCAGISTLWPLSRACFEGFGFISATMTNFDSDAAGAACRLATTKAEDRLSCLSGIARRLTYAGVSSLDSCSRLGLSGKGLAYCEKYADGDWQHIHTMPLPSFP